jgi:hypothetical protein
MGNFLDNVIQSREEWLKKPHPISNRARYLNAQANKEANKEANTNANTNANENAKPEPK